MVVIIKILGKRFFIVTSQRRRDTGGTRCNKKQLNNSTVVNESWMIMRGMKGRVRGERWLGPLDAPGFRRLLFSGSLGGAGAAAARGPLKDTFPYLGIQLGGVLSTSQVANNFIGTGLSPRPKIVCFSAMTTGVWRATVRKCRWVSLSTSSQTSKHLNYAYTSIVTLHKNQKLPRLCASSRECV